MLQVEKRWKKKDELDCFASLSLILIFRQPFVAAMSLHPSVSIVGSWRFGPEVRVLGAKIVGVVDASHCRLRWSDSGWDLIPQVSFLSYLYVDA